MLKMAMLIHQKPYENVLYVQEHCKSMPIAPSLLIQE